MATNDNNNGFNEKDYRFLVDAKNSRQYAIRYEDGAPVKPLHTFAIDERDAGFKANETIIAFDDEVERFVSATGGITLSTVAFQTKDAEEGTAAFQEKRKPRFIDG